MEKRSDLTSVGAADGAKDSRMFLSGQEVDGRLSTVTMRRGVKGGIANDLQ